MLGLDADDPRDVPHAQVTRIADDPVQGCSKLRSVRSSAGLTGSIGARTT